VFFISRRYQRLTLYSLEYDCCTTKWTRFVRHEVISVMFYIFKVSCLLYSVDWLVIKRTDFSKKHGFSIFSINQPEIMWFVFLRGCSSTTILNSVNQGKFLDDSVVHSWLTEDTVLKFHEWTEVKFTDQCCQGCPQTDRQQTATTNRSILPFYNADLKPVPIGFIELIFSPFLYKYRRENWALRKENKTNTIDITRDQIFQKNAGYLHRSKGHNLLRTNKTSATWQFCSWVMWNEWYYVDIQCLRTNRHSCVQL
jgi:hypothetical protein